ncbi:MAG: hypothetical protein HZB16_21770 [Armatimonadetes bacterium]|nr:hypothetical protein [Armatimonadota bacterium]
MHHEQPAWPPTPDQIARWLDGFEQATHSPAPPHADRPAAPPLSAGAVALVVSAAAVVAVVVYGCVTGLLGVLHGIGPAVPLIVILAFALISAIGRMVEFWTPPWSPESSGVDLSGCARWLGGWLSPVWSAGRLGQADHPHADALPVTVLADAQGIEVRTGTTAQREAWLELMSVQDHGTALVLVFEYGEALRVPREDVFEPVLSTARHVAAARAARQDAVRDDMEHGLSRADLPVDASRGLSRREH